MKNLNHHHICTGIHYLLLTGLLFVSSSIMAQISPPGYDREMEMRKAQPVLNRLERDSITLIDTVIVFDPTTYEESIQVTTTRYSMKEYCRNVLGIPDPDILLDGKPHTIVDPRNYGDMIIRLTPEGKIDTIPN